MQTVRRPSPAADVHHSKEATMRWCLGQSQSPVPPNSTPKPVARALAREGDATIERIPELQPQPRWAASETGCICNEGQPPSSAWGHTLRLQKLARKRCIRSRTDKASSRTVSSVSSHPERRGARLRHRQPPQGVGPRRRGSVCGAQQPNDAPSPPTAVVTPPPARGSSPAETGTRGRKDHHRHRDARFRLQQPPP